MLRCTFNRSSFLLGLLACLLGLTLLNSLQAQVKVEIFESAFPLDGSWPQELVASVETYEEDAFGFVSYPQRYVGTGVRADRPNPFLFRAKARLTLPPGRYRVLLRSRGAARLHFDDVPLASLAFYPATVFAQANSGELSVFDQDKALDLGPTGRRAPPGNREAVQIWQSDGQAVSVTLEVIVGGIEPKSKRGFRPELGETVVAIAREDSDTWTLLAPNRVIAYDDAGWSDYSQERQLVMEARNAAARRSQFIDHAEYWNFRRAAARAWLAETPPVPIPALPDGHPAFNAIDHFIGDAIHRAAASAAPQLKREVSFHRDVLPILETHCYSCHQGQKVKGGLRLDDRAAALRGGAGDGPAIVPGEPAASSLLVRVLSEDSEEVMPAKGDRLPEREITLLRRWIEEGAEWPEHPPGRTEYSPLSDDLTFLRRLALDTVGVIPTEAEIRSFLADDSPNRRGRAIDRYLADPRWADHQMGYWLDVLAENPNLLVPTLNNTGPFRFWLYDSFRDNKPFDVIVTELIRMEGSERLGGPAGFGVASQNDAPLAAKSIILGSAFMGVEMKCARCHDAPTHQAKQRDVFALAAMLGRQPQEVPLTSSVPLDHLRLGGRKPLIEVTLAPGERVVPEWPFSEFISAELSTRLAQNHQDSRDQLAALLTAPQNERFGQVLANRVWQRLMGRGFVADPGDWERSAPTHPALLRWLGRELVQVGYDLKALTRLIVSSHAYQRASDADISPTDTLYAARGERRLTAEQVVDSFFNATGLPFAVEPVNVDIDSVRTLDNALDLGVAQRAWALTSTSNERDRPSLMLPRMQAITEVLEVFGWRGARPDAASGLRDAPANPLQPALLANGTMMTWLTRLSDEHGITALALEDQPVERFISRIYLRLLSRKPTEREVAVLVAQLGPGYNSRKTPARVEALSEPRRHYVAWSNHMTEAANVLRLEEEALARAGPAPSRQLASTWRERCEDSLWAILNSPGATHVP